MAAGSLEENPGDSSGIPKQRCINNAPGGTEDHIVQKEEDDLHGREEKPRPRVQL